MGCEHCCDKDENDNWITPPCCDDSGICCASYNDDDEEDDISMCECCGAEMFKENGEWFHHTQRDIPYEERGTRHYARRRK